MLFARFAFAFWSGVCCKEAWDHSIHHLEYLRFLVRSKASSKASSSKACVCCKEAWDHSIHHLEYLRFLVRSKASSKASSKACSRLVVKLVVLIERILQVVGVTIFVVAVPEGLPLAGTHFTCYTSTKVHIMTHKCGILAVTVTLSLLD